MNQRSREEEIREIEETFAADPSGRKLRDLVVDYATRKGGITLAFIRLFNAPFWGDPDIVGIPDVAKRLGVSESQLKKIYNDMMDEVRPAWKASPEYRAPKGKPTE